MPNCREKRCENFVRRLRMCAAHVHGRNRDSRRGVALMLTLLVIVLLSALIVDFSYDTQVEGTLAAVKSDQFQAYLAAKSAIANALALLQEDLLDAQMNGTPESDGPMDVWAQGVPVAPLNDAQMRAVIADECGKINLNALIRYDSNGTPLENRFLIDALREFFRYRLAGSNLDPTDAILDWLDSGDDDEERPEGAERSYYEGLEPPYTCKNGPMDSIEELLLIKGITPEVYFGVPQENKKETQRPLSEYLTVHGDWLGRVNINTAPVEIIAAFIAACEHQPITETTIQRAQAIVDNLAAEPSGAYVDLSAVPDLPTCTPEEGQGGQAVPPNIPGLPTPGTPPRVPNSPSPRGGPLFKQYRAPQMIGPGPPSLSQGTGRGNAPPVPGQPQVPGVPGAPGLPGTPGTGWPWMVNSYIFRIYGDGMAGEALVRIEAYVWRTPSPEQWSLLTPGLPPDLQGMAPPTEAFRILQWRVIR